MTMAWQKDLEKPNATVECNGGVMNQSRIVRNVILFTAAGLLFSLASLALDAFLMEHGLSGLTTLYVSTALIGIAAGACVLQQQLLQDRKEQCLKERIECVSELHQHIRNVLTSLSLCAKQNGSAQAEVLSELLRRVENNLASMFSNLLFDPTVPASALKAAKRTVDSIAR